MEMNRIQKKTLLGSQCAAGKKDENMVLEKVFEKLYTDPKSIWNPKYRYQLWVTLTIQIFILSHGIALGWTSPTVHRLQMPDSPTNFVISVEQTSWIGSLYGVGSLLGNIFYGLIINRIGRKWCIRLMALPHMCAWILKLLSYTHIYLYVARFLVGVSGGANYVVIPIFISEISDCKIRGALSTISMLFVSFGILLGYVLSSHVNYYVVPCIVICLPVLYTLLIIRFPETPQHLLRKQKNEAAQKAFDFYKGLKSEQNHRGNNELEMQEGSNTDNEEFKQLQADIAKSCGVEEKLEMQDFFNKSALMAFCTCFMLIFLNQFSGAYAFFNYSSDIFSYTGSNFDPNTCTIVIGVAQMVGSFCATFLVDHFGRKFMMLLSSGGMATCLAIFGAYMQFTDDESRLPFNWIPLVLMTMAIVFACCGILSLIFTITVEVLPIKIRGIGNSICMSLLSLMMFVSLKLMPVFMHEYGLATVMFSCCGVCVLGWIYLFVFQKETNGESLNK